MSWAVVLLPTPMSWRVILLPTPMTWAVILLGTFLHWVIASHAAVNPNSWTLTCGPQTLQLYNLVTLPYCAEP